MDNLQLVVFLEENSNILFIFRHFERVHSKLSEWSRYVWCLVFVRYFFLTYGKTLVVEVKSHAIRLSNIKITLYEKHRRTRAHNTENLRVYRFENWFRTHFLSTYSLPIILFSFSYGFPCLHSKRLCLYDSSFQYPNNVFALLFCVCARYYRFVHLSWGQWVLSVLPFSLIYDYCIHRFLHLRLYFNNRFSVPFLHTETHFNWAYFRFFSFESILKLHNLLVSFVYFVLFFFVQ